MRGGGENMSRVTRVLVTFTCHVYLSRVVGTCTCHVYLSRVLVTCTCHVYLSRVLVISCCSSLYDSDVQAWIFNVFSFCITNHYSRILNRKLYSTQNLWFYNI